MDFDISYAETRRGGPLARDRRFVDAQSAHCDSKLTAAHCVIAAFEGLIAVTDLYVLW